MRTAGLVMAFWFVLQGWALSLTWPEDGEIIYDTSIQISFHDGTAPYTLTVLKSNTTGEDTELQVFENVWDDSVEWVVSVPDGNILFACTDADGESSDSGWQIVYPNEAVTSSTLSLASVLSTASIGQLSASARSAGVTIIYTTGPQTTLTGSPNPTSASSNSPQPAINIPALIGGVLGGVAGLLALALVLFCLIQRGQSNATNTHPQLPVHTRGSQTNGRTSPLVNVNIGPLGTANIHANRSTPRNSVFQ